jgi:hypothetical protein
MNSSKDVVRTADISQYRAAKVAGFLYLIIIVTSLLSMVFIESRLVVPGNDAATFNNIAANQLLFRIGAAYDLLMFASVVALAVALYRVLKPVSGNYALLALSWRLGEAILGAVTVLVSAIVLLLVNAKEYVMVFSKEQLTALVGLLLEMRSAGLTAVIVFLCLGTIVFCYLFYKSRYIPRWLAIWGILSFLLMLIQSFAGIIVPNNSLMIFGAPAIIFEITIGVWLLFKGINVQS